MSPVTSFYFTAPDELKFTSILQLLNFMAVIWRNCRCFLPVCRVDYTAPSGRNVSFHPTIPGPMYLMAARFPRIWVIIWIDFPGKLVLSATLAAQTTWWPLHVQLFKIPDQASADLHLFATNLEQQKNMLGFLYIYIYKYMRHFKVMLILPLVSESHLNVTICSIDD